MRLLRVKLIQRRLAFGQRVLLFVQDGQAAPLSKLVPFVYVKLKLRHRAYNTAAAHLRAIQAFYTYANSRDLDIDEAILACHFDGCAIWLQSGRQADNLVARIGTAATPVLVCHLTSRAPVKTQPPWLTSRRYLQMSPTSLNDALRAISSMFVPTALVTAA